MPQPSVISTTSSVRTIGSLSPGEMDAMHDLMTACYDAVPRERFDKDLSNKDEVLLLHDGSGNLCGFTTLAWNPAGRIEEGDVLFSGDTIIDARFRGSQELVKAFCHRAGQWKAVHGRPLYWFLISKGHRTYLYLPLSAKRFHPHPKNQENEWQALAGKVATRMFGDFWKPDEGLIRFPSSHGHLRETIVPSRGRNPLVKYFLERNPRYHAGEELVCLTELSTTNLRRSALGAFEAGMRTRP